MKKLILSVVFSIITLCVQAQIQVQVEPNKVTKGEVFKLSLIQDDPQNHGVPDLTVLQKEFQILGTERNISYSITNGQAQSFSQWIVALKAKKVGTLTIPAIKIGLEQSTPTSVDVVEGDPTQSTQAQTATNQPKDLYLKSFVNYKKAYVNQQITYTIKLYADRNKQLLNANYQEPKVQDALLISLGDAKRYQEVKDHTNYWVEEQSYAIFPQKSGSLKIKSPIFSALLYDLVPQRVQVQDKVTIIQVEPIPSPYLGKTWLPAKQIKLTERYENSNQTLSQGSTLTRVITIEGVGVPAQLLPSLHFEDSKAFNVYPEKGAEHNQVNQGEIIGRTDIRVTYLFNKAGKVTLPPLRLSWFNIDTQKEEIALLAPKSLDIMSSNTRNSAPSKNKLFSKPEESKTQSSITGAHAQSSANYNGWIAALIFALAWMVTLFLWLRSKKGLKKLSKESYKESLKELETACLANEPESARDALLKWASIYWPEASILNLTDLTKWVKSAPLKKQLNNLSHALYAKKNEPKSETSWRGKELLEVVKTFKQNSTRRKRKFSPLPPINLGS